MENKTIFRNFGWLVAGMLGVTMVASGFQAGATKFGVVDITKVLSDSTAGKSLKDDLTNEFNIRQGLLEFVNTNRTITAENAKKLRELSTKAGATAADKQAADDLKKAVLADQKKYDTLAQKSDLTEGERSELTDLGTRVRNTQGLLGQWQQEFSQELDNMQASKQADLVDTVKGVVQEVAKKDGYTVVFQSNVAVYCANDITDATTKALNAKK